MTTGCKLPLFLIFCLFASFGLTALMGKGIRGRLADAAAAVAAETPPETPAAKAHPGNRGGITKRIQAAEIDSSEPAARAGGVRKRIEINVPKVSETPPEQPLTKSLKKAWAAGRTITSDALQFSQDAKSSGASSLGPMSDDTKSSTNNFRKMRCWLSFNCCTNQIYRDSKRQRWFLASASCFGSG